MSDEVTIKVGDRVRYRSGGGWAGTVLAVLPAHGIGWAWVDVDHSGPSSYPIRDLVVIPPQPEPVPVSWRNVYGAGVSSSHDSRRAADWLALPGRLGVVIEYSDGSHKLEVVA